MVRGLGDVSLGLYLRWGKDRDRVGLGKNPTRTGLNFATLIVTLQ